jgi:branched-chain amino acid transport system substrate-binding protein
MNLSRRPLCLASVGVATLTLAAACGSSASPGASGGGGSASAGGTIKVGSIMSVTGSLAVFGVQEKQAIQLAFDQANKAGGVNGRQFQVTSYDPAGDTAQGVTLTRRLLDQDKVDVVVGGGASSGVALAMQQLITPRGIFFGTGEADPTLTSPVTKNPTTFQTTLTSATVAQAIVASAQSNGAKSIAVLADTGAFGQGGATAIKSVGGSSGLTVTAQAYDPTLTDLTPQLKTLQQSNPDAYVIWTASPSGVIAIKNAAALGLKLVYTAHSYGNPTFMQQAGDAAKILTVPVTNATVYQQALTQLSGAAKTNLQNFETAYKAAYNQDINIYAAEAYDAAEVTIHALQLDGGKTDGKTMAAALEKGGDYIGIMGTFHFSASDHYGLTASDIHMAKWSGTDWTLQG